MAEPLALVLMAPAAVTADGAATAVEIEGLQRVALLTVSVTAYTQSAAGSSVKVYIERRANTDEAWRSDVVSTDEDGVTTVDYLVFTGVGQQAIGVELGPLTRLRYDLTNMTTVTLGAAGEMHTVYARPSDLGSVLIAKAIREVTLTERVKACINATADADGRLALAHTLPLTAWGPDLTEKTAQLAVAKAMTIRGADITGPDSLVYQERDKALSWLNLVAAGRIQPTGLVDSTPEVYQAGAVVVSRPSRWGCR